jgi:histidine phosphotransfer protein HptB
VASGKGRILADYVDPRIEWDSFVQARDALGAGFVRILGYFREDSQKGVSVIEEAVRAGAPAPLVLPAHKLKTEAREFGAIGLAELAEHIELSARDFVEWRQDAGPLVEHVVGLRPLLAETLSQMDEVTNPLVQRRTVGRN